MGFDYSEFENYVEKLHKLSKGELERYFQEASREIAYTLMALVKEKTPVDTGTLRNRWVIKSNHKGDEYIVYIQNPMEYASYVEYGHRTRGGKGWVKGAYMLTISMAEIKSKSIELLQKYIEKYLKELFE